MRVLITGATGFVGTHLASYLMQNQDVEVFGASRDDNPALATLVPGMKNVIGDLCDEAFVREVLETSRPDVVYHLAGQASVAAAWKNPWETLEQNVLPQFNLFQSIIDLKLDPCFVTITSAKVYGHATADMMPLTEAVPLNPENPYDLSKVTEDLMAQQYFFSHKLKVIRARPFNHIGPRQSPFFVTAAFARQIARIEAGLQEPVMKVGNLSPARDFSDVRDVVRAYALLAEKGQPGQAYNIGSGHAVPVQTVLNNLLSLSSAEIEIQTDPDLFRPVELPLSYGSIAKIREEIGWQPEIPLRQSLQDILAYWREDTRQKMDA